MMPLQSFYKRPALGSRLHIYHRKIIVKRVFPFFLVSGTQNVFIRTSFSSDFTRGRQKIRCQHHSRYPREMQGTSDHRSAFHRGRPSQILMLGHASHQRGQVLFPTPPWVSPKTLGTLLKRHLLGAKNSPGKSNLERKASFQNPIL